MSVDVSVVALFRQRAAAQTAGRSIAALNSVWKRRGAALRNLLPQRLAASSLSPIHSTSVSVNSRQQRSLRSCQPDPCPQPGSPSLSLPGHCCSRVKTDGTWRFRNVDSFPDSSVELQVCAAPPLWQLKKKIVHFFSFSFFYFDFS